MSKLKEFIKEMPALCGAKYPEAYGKMNELMFDYELKNKFSEFSAGKFESIEDRLSLGLSFEGDEDKKALCASILKVVTIFNYEKKYGVSKDSELMAELMYLSQEGYKHPEVMEKASGLFSAEAQGFWS